MDNSALRNRDWHKKNMGTGQDPHKTDKFGCHESGGVSVPLVRFRHPIGNAASPEAGKRKK